MKIDDRCLFLTLYTNVWILVQDNNVLEDHEIKR